MNKNIFSILIIVMLVFLFGQINGFIPTYKNNQSINASISNVNQNIDPLPNMTNVIQKSVPSVVTIKFSQTNPGNAIEFNPFNAFRPFMRIPQQQYQTSQNIGSGFIVDNNGLIITNKHVATADPNATYTVITSDGKEYKVEKIYIDPSGNDIAILKIKTSGLTPIQLGDSTNLQLGEPVYAIGTPLGEFTNTVTSGIISGLGRGITAGSVYEGYVEKLDNVIQTDAPINPGNSGGPLINFQGAVIGINTAVSTEGQNIGFAIPVNIVKSVLSKYVSTGR
jgi:S1-C subfamily serine protease